MEDALRGAEPCDACGRTDCPDKHLCDVKFDNFTPVPARHPLEARREIAEAYGGGTVLDPDDIADITLAVASLMRGGRDDTVGAPTAVKRALRQGATLTAIASACDLDLSMVVGFVTQLPPSQALAVEEELRKGEHTFRSIGSALDVPASVVDDLAEAIGVVSPFQPRKYTDEEVARVWDLRDSGLSAGAIGKQTGLSSASVYAIMRRNAHPLRDPVEERARIAEKNSYRPRSRRVAA